MDLTQSIAVVVAVAIMQSIKILDQGDTLKKLYPLISVLVGLLTGGLYAYLVQNLDIKQVVWSAIITASGMQLAWAVKQSILKPLDITIPGDTAPKVGQ